MAKLRVHELAKELGITSKEAVAKLKELGEFVKSASSTVEAPAQKKLRDVFPQKNKKIEDKSIDIKNNISIHKTQDFNKNMQDSSNKKKTINLSYSIPKPGFMRKTIEKKDDSKKLTTKRSSTNRPGNNPFATSQGMPKPSPQGMSVPKPQIRPQQKLQNSSTSNGRINNKPSNVVGRFRRNNPDYVGRTQQNVRSDYKTSSVNTHGNNKLQKELQYNFNESQISPHTPNNRVGVPSSIGTNTSNSKNNNRRGNAAGAFGRGSSSKSKQRKSKREKRQQMDEMQIPGTQGLTIPKGDGSSIIRLRRGATLNDFADKINANPASLVMLLMNIGEMATATQSLDEDTFKLLGADLGYIVEIVSPEDEDRELLETFNINLEDKNTKNMQNRAPVVTVMGHVDHGKTRLLNVIRKSDIVKHEHGGITQHIGAYQIIHKHEGNNRAITFIDTPGHEAFTAMRARGAKVTDIAILVVAADDGVMPQTIEALHHAKSANVPIVVAVNKIDKHDSNSSKIRGQLAEYNLIPEEYGGDTMFVDVSAKTGYGIDELINAILLTADASLELLANPNKEARGIAIEANLDKGRGATVTVLIQQGTLHIGDNIVAGTSHGRVRAMFDENGDKIIEAGPARPVQVLGLTSVPRAGDGFIVTNDERTARQISERRAISERNALLAKRRKRTSLQDINNAIAAGKIDTLSLIIKGDVSGSVEALEDSLVKINVGNEVAIRIIHRGVGAITMNDVNLATVDKAVIIAFNVRAADQVAELAYRENIDIRYHSVIYTVLEEIESTMKGMLKPEFEEVQMGQAQVRNIFQSSKFGTIAGCIVKNGIIRRGSKARLIRNGSVIKESLTLDSLKRFKDDVVEVREGFECGIGLGNYNDIVIDDIIEVFTMKEKIKV